MLVQTFGYMISGDEDPAYQETYRFLYTMFARHYGIHLQRRAANEADKRDARSKMQIAEDLGVIGKLYATAYHYLFKLPLQEMTDEAFLGYVELIRSYDWADNYDNLPDSPLSYTERQILVQSAPLPSQTLPAVEEESDESSVSAVDPVGV